MQLPEDEHGFAMEDQVYLGDTGILIHPVVKKGAESVQVYLGESEVFPFLILLIRPTMISLITRPTKVKDIITFPLH